MHLFRLCVGLGLTCWLMACRAVPPAATVNPPLFVPRPAPLSLARQLAAYLEYPPSMQGANQQGIVVVSFRLSAAHRLTQLQVHASDPTLQAYLQQQLAGKFLRPDASPQPESYTVRLRFQLR